MEAKADMRNSFHLQPAEDELLQCPSCDARLIKSEVAQHCEQEIEQLRKTQLLAASEVVTTAVSVNNPPENSSGNGERRKPWTVFQRVQHNRQSRLRQRTRRRTVPLVEHPCPVCNKHYPPEEIQRHTENCLRKVNGTTSNGPEEHSSNEEDDGNGDEYEEYEWAGQKRIRVSSLLQGGYASIGVGQTISTNRHNGEAPDEEEDLNVDEDDTQIYGPAQYGETDVIPPTEEQNDHSGDGYVTSYMRRLITGNVKGTPSTSTAAPTESDTDTSTDIPTQSSDNAHAHEATSSTSNSTSLPTQHYCQIIESLKAKLRHYENHVPSKFKCLICLDDYRNPAISVACWHVHCEDCWLRTLGARKLCPQCNLITTPKDLRRIYM